MNPEDNEFVESLNCWEDNYDVITDNIQKLSGLLSLQIRLLQNIQEKKEHERNVRHVTLEEQSISRMLNSFEQRFNIELSKLTDFSNKLDTLLTGQQVLVTRVAQIEEKLAKTEISINSHISVGKDFDAVKFNEVLKGINNKIYKASGVSPRLISKEEFVSRLQEINVDKLVREQAKVVPATSNKKFITRTIDVFKQQVDTNMFVYVGTMTDNVLTLNQSAVVLETHITKPSTYFTDWFIKNNNPAIGCQWLDVHPSNTVNEILVKDKYMDKFVTTGYLTNEGRAVYYDQYL